MKKEKHPSVENLLTNESFLSWYFGASECERTKWNNNITTNDAGHFLTEEAASLLNDIIIKEQKINESQLNKATEQLMQKLLQSEPAVTNPLPHKRPTKKKPFTKF